MFENPFSVKLNPTHFSKIQPVSTPPEKPLLMLSSLHTPASYSDDYYTVGFVLVCPSPTLASFSVFKTLVITQSTM